MVFQNDITIVVADDHPMLLKGLSDELIANNYTVVGQATNGMEALELILSLKPTIALLDIDMPMFTGFEVIQTVKNKGLDTRFIVLSFHKEADYIAQAKALQIDGYLLKEDSFYDIERCIEAVSNGEEYFSRSFESSSLRDVDKEFKNLLLLTPSEIVILKLIAQQSTTKDIADTLCVSARTVEKHRSNIKEKLQIDGVTNALTNWALVNKKIISEL